MAQNDDKFLLILEKISEVSERTTRIETKMERLEQDVSFIKEEDVKQNTLLAEHIQGTITNRQRLEVEIQNRKDLEGRVIKLEEPRKFLINLKSAALYIAAMAGAVSAILALMSKLN